MALEERTLADLHPRLRAVLLALEDLPTPSSVVAEDIGVSTAAVSRRYTELHKLGLVYKSVRFQKTDVWDPAYRRYRTEQIVLAAPTELGLVLIGEAEEQRQRAEHEG